MRRNTLSRGLLVVLLFAVTVLYPLLAPPAHRIDNAHRVLIREGMTLADVESVFGVPAGAYDWAVASPRPGHLHTALIYLVRQQRAIAAQEVLMAPAPSTPEGSTAARLIKLTYDRLELAHDTRTWTGRHGSVSIGFDDAGRITWIDSVQDTRRDPPWNRWWRKLTGSE